MQAAADGGSTRASVRLHKYSKYVSGIKRTQCNKYLWFGLSCVKGPTSRTILKLNIFKMSSAHKCVSEMC